MDDGGPTADALVIDEQSDVSLDPERWRKLAVGVLQAAAVGRTEVCISFVNEARIAELKRTHLDGDGSATDVLAFPLDAPDGGLDAEVPHLLGDVVICPAVAARQAPDHAGTFDDEVALLVVHGLLHLLGMDHAERDDRRDMQARERTLLDQLHGPLAGEPWRDRSDRSDAPSSDTAAGSLRGGTS